MKTIWITLGCAALLVLASGCEDKSASPTATPATPATPAEPATPATLGKPAPVATRPAVVVAPTTQPAVAKPAAESSAPRVDLLIAQGGQDWGHVVIELDPVKAPISTKNFLRYVEDGFYDGTIFHRVDPNFMIQGGGFVSNNEQKTEGLHEPIQNEAKNGLKNKLGAIAMARTSDPHSATAQFFINVKDNVALDYPSRDGWGYAVFGQVVDGMDVVDRIKNVETRPNPRMGGENSQPLDPPAIRKAVVVK